MVIKKLRYSGAYKMFIWLAEALSERGHDITVCTYMRNEVHSLQPGIKWVHTDLEGRNILLQLNYVRRELKKANADLSISFLLDANILNILACMGLKTKSVVCERNDPFKPHYTKLKIAKPLFKQADGAVFQLPKVAEYYDNIKGHTAVIPNPVLCKTNVSIKRYKERDNIIVTLGRLDIFQKRHDILIKAFSLFHFRHPEFKLLIYGDGSDEKQIRTLISKLGLEDKVLLKGVTSTPLEVIAKAKIFVLSSDFEGIPNALIEAMSIGLPCISTDCRPGGAKILIQEGKNGYIVNAGDYEALAEKMCFLVENPNAAEAVGAEAVKIKDTFSESNIITKWIDYLQPFVQRDF